MKTLSTSLRIAIGAAALVSALSAHAANSPEAIGGQRDKYGCLGPAGYTWSAPMKKCIRTWEHYTIDAASIATGNKKLDQIITKQNNITIDRFRNNAEKLIVEKSLTGSTGYSLSIAHAIVNSGSLISVKTVSYAMLGGAHGLEEVTTNTFDVKTGKIVPITKFLSKPQLKTAAKSIAQELAKRFGDGADKKAIANGLSVSKLSNYRAFTVQTDKNNVIMSITIYTNDSQV